MKRIVLTASVTAVLALSAGGIASAAKPSGAVAWSHSQGAASWGSAAWSRPQYERNSRPQRERNSYAPRERNAAAWA